MKVMKRNIFMLLMLAIFAVFGFGSISAQAASAPGYFTYENYGSGVKVTKYSGGEDTMNIPAQLGGKNVLAVGMDIIINKDAVKRIVIPETVTVIEGSAFANCTALQSVSMGANVTALGDNAFNGCTNLSSINFPSKLRTLGTNAFYGTDLYSVVIPGNVETIGTAAFSHCVNLRNAEIKNGTVNIGANAFSHCTYLNTLEIPNSVRSIGANVVAESVAVTIWLHYDSYADKYFENYNRNKIAYYDSEYAAEISLNKTSIVLYAGLSEELSVKNAADYDDAIVWESYNTGVATVDNYGKVTGVGKGTVTIRATATGGATKTATVEVKPAPTSVSLVQTGKTAATSSHTLYMGQTMNLSIGYTPEDAAGAPGTTLTSSNPKIATVNASGLVTPVAEGTVNIIARTYNGKSVSYQLTVTRNRKDLTSMKTRSLVLAKGKTANLGAISGMTYTSSNTKVATVTNTGLVTAKAAGTAVITVYNNDYIAKCTVTVYKPATQVKFKSAKLKNGKVTLKWKKQSHVSGYQVYYKVGSGKYTLRSTKKAANKVTFTSGKLKKKNKTYYYKVRAYVKVGSKKYYGPWSKVKKFKNI